MMTSPKKSSQKAPNESKNFRIQGKVIFLTFSGAAKTFTKFQLLNYLLNQNQNEKLNKPEKYMICEQKYATGLPHFHVILSYQKQKDIKGSNFYDYLGIHPNIQSMRNLPAALAYMHKEDPQPLTNMNLTTQKLKLQIKDNESLYAHLEDQMKKDPFNFNAPVYCNKNDITRETVKLNFSKIFTFLKLIQEAHCNQLLSTKPGFQLITRALIKSTLSPKQLQLYDSWRGYQTIVDHLNQIHHYGNKRPMKTMNLLITGPKSIGKTSLFHNPNH